MKRSQACTVRLRYLLCCRKLSLSRRALGRAHRLNNSNKEIPSEPAYGVWHETWQNAERGWSVGWWHAIGQFQSRDWPAFSLFPAVCIQQSATITLSLTHRQTQTLILILTLTPTLTLTLTHRQTQTLTLTLTRNLTVTLQWSLVRRQAVEIRKLTPFKSAPPHFSRAVWQLTVRNLPLYPSRDGSYC